MALLGVTVYNMGARQRQVSGGNEHEMLPVLMTGAVLVYLLVFSFEASRNQLYL
jgi:hypothetical protein